MKAVVETLDEVAAGGPRRGNHLHGVRRVAREGLFDEHVFAVFRRRDHSRCADGGKAQHEVHVVSRHELGITTDGRRGSSAARRSPRPLGVARTDGHHLGAEQRVRPGHDAAGSVRAAPRIPMRIMGGESRMSAVAATLSRKEGVNVTAVLIGASGRMGAAIVRANLADGTLAEVVTIVAAVGSPGGKSAGRDLGEVAGVQPLGVRVATELPPDLAGAQVAIDFSRPELSLRALNVCARGPRADRDRHHGPRHEIRARVAAARDIAVLVAPNTSIGVAVAQELVRIAATAPPAAFDIEIVEAHHKHKVDAPSGTALALADSAARRAASTPARYVDRSSRSAGPASGRNRHRQPARRRYRRSHTVLFAGAGERLTIGHEATDRSIFAHGAIRAAGLAIAQKPGRYSMANVLGLKTAT